MQKTIEYFKSRAILKKKGSIVPNWILRVERGSKSLKHHVTFGCDTYVLPYGDRHVIWPASPRNGEYLVRVRNIKSIAFTAGHGMLNFFTWSCVGIEVSAEEIAKQLDAPLRVVTLRHGNDSKIKGTKLQRRREKFAARSAAAQKGGE